MYIYIYVYTSLSLSPSLSISLSPFLLLMISFEYTIIFSTGVYRSRGLRLTCDSVQDDIEVNSLWITRRPRLAIPSIGCMDYSP